MPSRSLTDSHHLLTRPVLTCPVDDLSAFLEAFGSLSTGNGTVSQVRALTKLLRPHLLRREKSDVEAALQPMQETLLHVEITNMQK